MRPGPSLWGVTLPRILKTAVPAKTGPAEPWLHKISGMGVTPHSTHLSAGPFQINQPPIHRPMIALITQPMFAAVGYSLIYLLGGGGLVGAFVIFVIAKMFNK